jgi:hypothetical protein
MKKILELFKNWFERNGLIKIVMAFIILIFAVMIGENYRQTEIICSWVAIISGGYLLLTAAIFTIAGIVNAIKDAIDKRNKKKNTEE